jgi:formaldehyde-activating enzyme involved in methanogenesis
VYANNRAATTQALWAGAMDLPQVTDVLRGADRPVNPFYTAPAPGNLG